MIPSFMDIEIAKRGLQVSQAQIDVTGHNINNADNPDYSRQSANQITNDPYHLYEAGKWQEFGTGTSISDVSRARDQFVDNRFREVNSMQTMYQTRDNELQQIAGVFNEPTVNGFQTSITSFFNSWQELSKHPEDAATRSFVVQQGAQLTQGFQTIHQQLSTLNSNYQNEVQTYVSDINNISTQIAQLNDKIQQSNLVGGNANDLLDQRDKLVDKLATYANVSITTSQDASNPSITHYTLSFGGTTIVSDKTATSITAASVNPTSGNLKALADLQTYSQNVSASVDKFAQQIMNDVNQLHKTGYGFNSQTNVSFFTGTDASNIAVNSVIVNDPTNIAAAAAQVQGDGSNALSISNLMNANHYDQTYGSIVANIGVDNNSAHQNLLLYQGLTTQVQQTRTAISGVSVNEEMANMVRFNQAYSAAARLLSTIDQMYSALFAIQ